MIEHRNFKNFQEFFEFKENIENDSLFISMPVDFSSEFYKLGFSEYWYLYLNDNTIWRLVEPAPPFSGVCERVKN